MATDPAEGSGCAACQGAGRVAVHSEWCRNPDCKLAKGQGDCHGRYKKCQCKKIKVDKQKVAEVYLAYWDKLIDTLVTHPNLVPDDTVRADVYYSWRAEKIRMARAGEPKGNLLTALGRAAALAVQARGALGLSTPDGFDELIQLLIIMCGCVAGMLRRPAAPGDTIDAEPDESERAGYGGLPGPPG